MNELTTQISIDARCTEYIDIPLDIFVRDIKRRLWSQIGHKVSDCGTFHFQTEIETFRSRYTLPPEPILPRSPLKLTWKKDIEGLFTLEVYQGFVEPEDLKIISFNSKLSVRLIVSNN